MEPFALVLILFIAVVFLIGFQQMTTDPAVGSDDKDRVPVAPPAGHTITRTYKGNASETANAMQ